MSLRPITNGECERTRSSARYTDAFFAQKPSASAVVKTSASIASSRVLPFSSMTVVATRQSAPRPVGSKLYVSETGAISIIPSKQE